MIDSPSHFDAVAGDPCHSAPHDPSSSAQAPSARRAAGRPPFSVMVRLDRTISPNTPVRTRLRQPMVRSSRTMTRSQQLPFHPPACFSACQATPKDDGTTEPAGQTEHRRMTKPCPTRANIVWRAAGRPPFSVMVRLDRTISPNRPVRTRLRQPMVRSSRTMTRSQQLPFHPPACFNACQATPKDDGTTKPAGQTEHRRMTKPCPTRANIAWRAAGRLPLIVMVRLDRTISLNRPVRTRLRQPMVRSSRTMTRSQQLPFHPPACFSACQATPEDDGTTEPAGQTEHRRMTKLCPTRANIVRRAAGRPPFSVMVRLDRTISPSRPVRTRLRQPMVRSSRTMTRSQQFPFHPPACFNACQATPKDDGITKPAGQTEHRRMTKPPA